MNRILLAIMAAVGISLTACAQKAENKGMDGAKILVAYFSATGTTESVAEKIADATGGQLYEIVPEKEYTSADLNWNDDRSRSSVEMNNPESRPSLGGNPVDIAAYDVIFIGYPIWWDQAPRIINTFIESHDLKGKTVIPFATSGGSGISNSVEVLRSAYPGLNIQDGKLLNGASSASIRSWLDTMK